MRHRNRIHFEHETLHIRYWAWRVYCEQCVGRYVPRLGGWT